MANHAKEILIVLEWLQLIRRRTTHTHTSIHEEDDDENKNDTGNDAIDDDHENKNDTDNDPIDDQEKYVRWFMTIPYEHTLHKIDWNYISHVVQDMITYHKGVYGIEHGSVLDIRTLELKVREELKRRTRIDPTHKHLITELQFYMSGGWCDIQFCHHNICRRTDKVYYHDSNNPNIPMVMVL